MLTDRQNTILNIINTSQAIQAGELKQQLQISQATLNRELKTLVELGWISKIGAGRSTRYSLSNKYHHLWPIDITAYYQQDAEDRTTQHRFNFEVFNHLAGLSLFNESEIATLTQAQTQYQNKTKNISPGLLQKEWERFTIELSWKSSEIEGNTYDLLETEALFKYREKASGKTDTETAMLLNHKQALNYVWQHPTDFSELDVKIIENLHRILVQKLGVSFNLRNRPVGVTGTKYRPLDNQHQIREALQNLCQVVNSKTSFFEKALLLVLGISYLQPFEDGNKRTGRILANAVLMAGEHCPLSYRSVSAVDYKKALLVFYEQNNLHPFKQLFIQQYQFAVENYF